MNSWTRVIIEWANCLGIVESTIDSLDDLNDGVFYEKLVFQLCRGNEEDFSPAARKSLDPRESVSKFLRGEYPDYRDDPSSKISDNVYTASLLLAQCSQQPLFHRPMCVALRHETQIQIKRFLEMVLPSGKNLTRETLASTIAELGDVTSNEASTTPQVRPLREFFNSPAVRSARAQRFMNDRNRELMSLRAQLETEQFEKADLLQDLKIQNEKIASMQKKLQDKSRELRELRNERFKPVTPQSCRKKRPSDNEERLRREIDSLETVNAELGAEIEKLRDEREEFARHSMSNDRLVSALRDKYEQSEKNIEALLSQLDGRNRELIDLRIHCEELREHMRQMKRASMGEQSFADIEPICDEALSSIVDIQLQEAREESSQLKNELSDLKIKLAHVQRDSEELRRLEIVLQEKTVELDELRSSILDVEDRLRLSSEKSANLELENSRLIEDSKNLRDLVKTKCESQEILEKQRESLENELRSANLKNSELENFLDEEKSRIVELRSSLTFAETESTDLRKLLSTNEEKLSQLARDKENLISNLNEKTRELRESEVSLNNQNSEIAKLKVILASREEESRDLKATIASRDEQISSVNGEKKLLERNLEESERKIVEHLESLEKKKSRIEELQSCLTKVENDFKDLLKSNEKLLNNERSRNVELETMISREKRENEELRGMLEELQISLRNEKTGNDELREIVERSTKITNELESILETKEKILEESTVREKSLENDLDYCKERLKNLELSLSNETSKIVELESQLCFAEKKCCDLETELSKNKVSLEEMEIAKNAIESEFQDANDKIREIEDNVGILKDQLSIVESEKKESILANVKLEEYARVADEKLVNVEIKISDYERRIRQLDQISEENRENLEKLCVELKERNCLVDSLTVSLEETKKSTMELTDIVKTRDKKIAELMELREEMDSQLSQEREKSTILRDRNETLDNELANYVRSMIELREGIVKIESEFNRSEEKLQNEIKQSEELQKNLENSIMTNNDLVEKLKKETNQSAILESEKIVLNKQLDSYVHSEEEMKLKISQLEQEVELSAENLRKMTDENSSLGKEILSSTELVKKLREEIVKIESEFHRSEEKLQNAIKQSEELQKNLENSITTNNDLVEKLKKEKNKSAILESEKIALNEQLDSYVNSKEEMKLKISQLEQEVELSAENLRKKMDENSSLENKILSSTELVEKLREEILKIKSEFHRSEEKLQNEIKQSEELQKNLENSITTNNDLVEKLKKEKNQSAILESEKVALNEQLDSYVNSEEEMKLKISQLEQEVELSAENLRKKMDENSSLENKILSSTELVEKLREEILKIKSEFHRSEEKLQNEIKQSEELQKNLENSITTNNDLVEKLKKEKNQSAILESEKVALNEQLDSYVNSEEEMKLKISQLEQEVELSAENLRKKMDENSSLENKILSSTELVEKLREEILKIKSEFHRSEEKLQNEIKQSEELQKNLENSITTNNDLVEKLKKEKNQSAILESEKVALNEQLDSYVNSEEEMKLKISQLEQEVELSAENLRKKMDENSSLENKILSSTELVEKLREEILKIKSEFHRSEEKLQNKIKQSEELQKNLENSITTNNDLVEKLKKEKNQSAILESEKIALNKQLDSYVNSEEEMKLKISQLEQEVELSAGNLRKMMDENSSLGKEIRSSTELIEKLREEIVKIESEFHRSEEKLQNKIKQSEELQKNLENSITTNNDLVEKLKKEKNQSAILESEKIALNKQLDSYVNSEEEMKLKISQLEQEVELSAENLRKMTDENSSLENKILSSTELAEKLGQELITETRRAETLENDIKTLNEQLSSFSCEKADMIEELSALHKELEGSRSDLEKLRETSAIDSDKLHRRINDLINENERRSEKIHSLESEIERSSLERERLSHRLEDSCSSVASLEKRLLVAQNSRDEAKLDEKLKQESLLVVSAKLEKLNKEKIENELKMKEVIMNLQEVRTSQDQVLKAQVKAIGEKSDRLLVVEKEAEDLKLSLTKITQELENEKSKVREIQMDFDELRLKSERDSNLVEELERSLSVEREKSKEAEKVCESTKSKISMIRESSNKLKIELNSLWDSVRKACPELARPTREIDDQDSENFSPEIVDTFVEDVKTLRKVVSILSEANETLKEHLDGEKENAKITAKNEEQKKCKLDERLNIAEKELEKRDLYLSLLAKRRKDIQELLSRAINERNKVDDELANYDEKWKKLNAQAQTVLKTGSSTCDETKNLLRKRNELDDIFASFHESHAKNSKNLLRGLCRIFLWSETKLQLAHEVSSLSIKEEFSPEAELSREIRNDEIMRDRLTGVDKKISEFTDLLDSYEVSLKAGIVKSNCELKLQAQLEKMTKERGEFKEKLEASRIRNAKMEKNLDELRNVIKKVKSEISESTSQEDRTEIQRLRELTKTLQDEKEELTRRLNDEKDIDARLEIVHNEYGQKLERIKEKMKTAYNEQMAKVNQEQEKAVREKMNTLKSQMEQQCRKYTEDIAKYKAHISDLSSRYWDVGEKLLAETQEKQAAIQQLQRLKGKQQQHEAVAEVSEQIAQSRHKTASLDRREFAADRGTKDPNARSGYRAVEVIEEETTTFSTRRHSVKSIQAMGNAFKAEDEEGEVFDSVFLADLKEGRCVTDVPDYDRLTQLRMRNSMCKPHLKSSYAVETHLQPVALNEDDIKNGVAGDDVFNDSLSQSLLPGQKPKKKDRTQTSYKRPGPPTPSKNGGRLSLQGNELKSPSSRILKERNTDRRTTATPRGLKNLFGTSMSKRQDENTAGTPKGRRLSNIFRKQRVERN